jgi:hypothetical protein
VGEGFFGVEGELAAAAVVNHARSVTQQRDRKGGEE